MWRESRGLSEAFSRIRLINMTTAPRKLRLPAFWIVDACRVLLRIPPWIPGGNVRLWTEKLHNVSTVFAWESEAESANTRRSVTETSTHTKRRIRVYAPTMSLLLLPSSSKVTKEEEEGETGKEKGTRSKLCSALEQFLDAYCHALLSPESTGHYQSGRKSTLMRRLKSGANRRCGW